MKKNEVESIFTLAGIDVIRMYELPNGYTGLIDHPWWLVKTSAGLIKIGWRKRVISIDWSCLLYTSPSPRDGLLSRMPSSA